MAEAQDYSREKNGQRFQPGGMVTTTPLDSLFSTTNQLTMAASPAKYAFLQNVRGYRQQQIIGRATASTPVVTGLPVPVHTLKMLNDTTPGGPVGGYVRVIGAAGAMYVNFASVATGLSGNPVSLCPFRPNQSVAPWMYVADSSQAVTIPSYIASGYGLVAGMLKIRSDGLTEKMGVKEPQLAPEVTTQSYTTTGTDTLPATTIPWTNVGGENPSYNYGQTSAADGTAPVVVTGGGPFLVPGASVTLTVAGTATVNGLVHAPGDAGPTSASFPGAFIPGAKIVVGCFTDSAGNVVPPGGSLPLVFPVGAGTTVTVPALATQLQVGIDSQANTFHLNSGNFSLTWSVTVSAIATVLSTLGPITAYVWGTPPPAGGGSPHSGPVASYIWKNPSDGGSGIARSLSDPVPDVSPTNNSWIFDSSPEDGTVPVNWTVLKADGSVASTIPLFTPQLESAGYQDFNVCIVGNLFVPAAGTYAITFQYKDQIMVGITGGGTGVSVAYSSGASPFGTSPIGGSGQTISVINSLPLVFVSNPNGSGTHQTTTMNFTFTAGGTYQIEVGWDYWFHTGRSFIMTCPSSSPNSPTIPPISANIRTGVQYRYIYRDSRTGAKSNPSPESPIQFTPVLANQITSVFSTDPQVDKVDYFRVDDALTNFTYVATGPNDGLGGTVGGVTFNTPVQDELSDTQIATNQILEFDNYEPFPVLDKPKKGVVNVTGGVISWVSGDHFNIRWLPGTLILIGSPTSLAYSFIARPISTTSVTIPEVPDGTNLAYEIPEPVLAAQPLAYMWGPTDNVAYDFAVGDLNNPGTLYFTKGNNPDSAPETNQLPVTSPAEALINGVKTAAMAMVWTAERRWLIYPTFTTALATVTGVEGTPFNVVEATGSRGLYMPNCLCTNGGTLAYFRAKDGIWACEFGGADQFVCQDIYNLFPREGIVPQPISIAGNVINPPDDTNPSAQKLAYANGYLYYDYEDIDSTPITLVYDEVAQGWSIDVGENAFTVHALEEGPKTNTTMVGTLDGGSVGSVRVLGSGNPEVCTSVVIPGSQNAGDARAQKELGDVFIKAIVFASNPINVALYANRYLQALTGYALTALTGTGSLLPYIIDATNGFSQSMIDLGAIFSWPTASGNILDLWQPTFLPLPEDTQDRPTDWEDCGDPGNKFIQGLLLEADTNNVAKAIRVQRSDDLALFTPNESPITCNGQSIKTLTFTPPFLAHSVRIVTTDGVPWRHAPTTGWTLKWVFVPFPSQTVEWQTEMTSHGLKGWQHIRELNIAYQSTTALTLTLVFDQWPTITITIPSSSGVQTKYKTPSFPNKFKLVSYRLSSSAPFFLWKDFCEVKVKQWGSSGPYESIMPYGGEAQLDAKV